MDDFSNAIVDDAAFLMKYHCGEVNIIVDDVVDSNFIEVVDDFTSAFDDVDIVDNHIINIDVDGVFDTDGCC
jgi:hypothetical protein